MPLISRKTGEPPKPLEELEQQTEQAREKYENILLKKSLAESIQQTADEYAMLKEKYEQFIDGYESLLQRESERTKDWEEKLDEKLDEKVSKLQSLNEQLQNSIDQKIKDLSGELERNTIEKVKEVTEQAEKKISDITKEWQDKTVGMLKKVKAERGKISEEYRAAFSIGVGWKILMAMGSVAWILILLLKYAFNVV